jgi:Ti-type conjugative transfer relaxase TraA
MKARSDIEQAHNKSVAAALSYLETRAFSSRDRDQYGQPVKSILAATYQHGTSRELDPQLHTHAAVANLGMRADGTYCALDFDTRFKMVGGAIYRAELAAQLMRLGYAVERDSKSFGIVGIDQSICNVFSKRRSQIVERLQQTGYTSAKAASFAALNTRQEKQMTDRQSQFDAWQKEASSLGLNLNFIANEKFQKSTAQHLAQTNPAPNYINIDAILKELTAQSSTFTSMQLEAAIAIEAQGVLDAQQIECFVRETIAARVMEQGQYALIRLHDPAENIVFRRRETLRFTTREILQIENHIIQNATARNANKSHIASCEKSLKNYNSLSDEQINALRHITQEFGAVKAVRGLAGTGKSFLLRAAKESWLESNFKVTGAALAGKAAQSLEEGSGIKSQTLHSLLNEITSGRKILTANDIIVIDEAGMIGSRQMNEILNYIYAAEAKAVLVGDPLQLQPIDAGGIFRSLSDKLGYASLTEIRRQELEPDRTMIHDLIEGKSKDVISSLSERGMLETASTDDVYNALVDKWSKELSPDGLCQSLILAGTKTDVYKVNILARERLAQQHRLHSEVIVSTEHGERAIAVGERIVFTRNSRALGVKNGQTGILAKWCLDKHGEIILQIETENKKSVSVNINEYKHLDYGYALSVHKSQGQTVDKVYILISDVMTDREWSYVALSRHRKQLSVFATEEQIDSLHHQFMNSRQKDVSIDYVAHDLATLAKQEPEYEVAFE